MKNYCRYVWHFQAIYFLSIFQQIYCIELLQFFRIWGIIVIPHRHFFFHVSVRYFPELSNFFFFKLTNIFIQIMILHKLTNNNSYYNIEIYQFLYYEVEYRKIF